MRCFAISLTLFAVIPFSGCAKPGEAPVGRQSGEAKEVSSNNSAAARLDVAESRPTPAVSEVRVVDENQFQSVLEELRGNVVLIDFWGTWCAPCLELLPHTLAAADKYGPRGLTVVAVAIDDPAEVDAVDKKLAERSGYVIPLISKYGISSDSVEKFGISDGALPHLKLLDRSGKIVESFGVGGTPPTPENIDAAIERALGTPGGAG